MIQGYAEVLPDRVIVLAEISERAEEIDVARAKAAHERAQAELAKTSAGSPDWQERKLAVERALVRTQAAASGAGAPGIAQVERHDASAVNGVIISRPR